MEKNLGRILKNQILGIILQVNYSNTDNNKNGNTGADLVSLFTTVATNYI